MNVEREDASEAGELKWETPTSEDLIWVSLFFFTFLLIYFVVVIIFSDIGTVFLLFTGLVMFLIGLLAWKLDINLPWQLGVVLAGGIFLALLVFMQVQVGLVNMVIVMLLFFGSFFSLFFGIGFFVNKTTRKLTFQYRGGYSEIFCNELIAQIEEWLNINNVSFHKAYQEIYENKYFVIEPQNREEIVLIVDRDFKGDEEFHQLILQFSRKEGISSLVDYEEDLLDIVLSMIWGHIRKFTINFITES